MDLTRNIEIKEEISYDVDEYEGVENQHIQINNIKSNITSNFFHEIKAEHELKSESNYLKEYSFEECAVCRSIFPNKYSLLQHHLRHLIVPLSKLDFYKCDHCQLLFTEKNNIDHHINVEHKNEDNEQNNIQNNEGLRTKKNHKCHICNKTFSYGIWHGHMNTVHGKAHLTCDQCDKTFKCQRYLLRHKQKIHERKLQLENSKFFFCKQCPKGFKNGDCLNKHIKNCHGQKVRCQICDSVLKSAAYLSSHMRRVHCDRSKTSQCHICGKQMKSERQVRIHVTNMHNKKHCPNCGKMFNTAYLAYSHVKSCNDTAAQNVQVDKSGNVDETVTSVINDRVKIDNCQYNGNPHDQNDVKLDVVDQLNKNNNAHSKKTFEINKYINKTNRIGQDVVDNIDIADCARYNSFQVYENGSNNDDLSISDDIHESNGDTVCRIRVDLQNTDINYHTMKVYLQKGDINDRIKGDAFRNFSKVCDKTLESEEKVKNHMNNAHTKSLPLKCQYCGVFFNNLKYYSDHIKKCSVRSMGNIPIKIKRPFHIKIEQDNEINDWVITPI